MRIISNLWESRVVYANPISVITDGSFCDFGNFFSTSIENKVTPFSKSTLRNSTYYGELCGSLSEMTLNQGGMHGLVYYDKFTIICAT